MFQIKPSNQQTHDRFNHDFDLIVISICPSLTDNPKSNRLFLVSRPTYTVN